MPKFSVYFAVGILLSVVGLICFVAQLPPASPTSTLQTKPYFIPPDNAMCTKAVGEGVDGVVVYLCKTEDNHYFYVRVTPATMFESKVNHPFVEGIGYVD